MFLLIVDNHLTARPLIDFYHLKRTRTVDSFENYCDASGDYRLVVCNAQPIISAAISAYALAAFGFPRLLCCVTAYAPRAIGELLLLSRIIAEDRSYYPDMLHGTQLTEVTAITVPVEGGHPVLPRDASNSLPVPPMVAAVCQTALRFMGPHRLLCAAIPTGQYARAGQSLPDYLPQLEQALQNSASHQISLSNAPATLSTTG